MRRGNTGYALLKKNNKTRTTSDTVEQEMFPVSGGDRTKTLVLFPELISLFESTRTFGVMHPLLLYSRQSSWAFFFTSEETIFNFCSEVVFK